MPYSKCVVRRARATVPLQRRAVGSDGHRPAPVVAAARAAMVASTASIAWLEHQSTREDAVFVPDEPLPFERRLGAFPLGDGHAGFRVWAPLPRAHRAARGRARARARARRPRRLRGRGRGAAGRRLRVRARRHARCRTRARAGSRRACAARRGCSTPALRVDRRRLAAAGRSASSCSTSCTSARSRPRGRSRPRSRTCASCASSASPRSS